MKREEALRSEAEQEVKLMKLKCEKAESKAYNSQEDLVKDLTSSRDVVSLLSLLIRFIRFGY